MGQVWKHVVLLAFCTAIPYPWCGYASSSQPLPVCALRVGTGGEMAGGGRRGRSVTEATATHPDQEKYFTWARRGKEGAGYISANKLNNVQECSWAGSVTARPGELFEQSLARLWHVPTSAAPGSFRVRFGSRRVPGTILSRLVACSLPVLKAKGVYWRRLSPLRASWPPCPGMFPGTLNLLVEMLTVSISPRISHCRARLGLCCLSTSFFSVVPPAVQGVGSRAARA